MSQDFPQVALFGTIPGGWREKQVIPVLETLGITYYNPVGQVWTPEMGEREAQIMAHAQTIVMVFNHHSAALAGLTETGWAALGAYQRGQTFILCIEPGYRHPIPFYARLIPGVGKMAHQVEQYALRARKLVLEHAQRHEISNLHVVDNLDEVVDALRLRYGGAFKKPL